MENGKPGHGLAILALATLLVAGVSTTPASAQNGEFNFGSVQGSKSTTIEPGSNHTFTLLFFNEGDKITHVKLSAKGIPENWDVEITPGTHDQKYNVSGITRIVQENLYILPYEKYGQRHGVTPPLDSKPETAPNGVKFINLAGVDGYIPAKIVKIKIHVPKSEGLGKDADVTISANAFSLTGGGTVSVSQARDFKYSIATKNEQFSEMPVEDTPGQTDKEPGGEPSGIPENIKLIAALIIGFALAAILLKIKKSL